MIELSGKILTSLDVISKEPERLVFNHLKSRCFSDEHISVLDKWLYFYLYPVSDPVTVWAIGNNFYVDPGFNRFVGRSLRGETWITARFFSQTLIKENHPNILDLIEITNHEVDMFPTDSKSIHYVTSKLGIGQGPNEFWNQSIPKMLSEKVTHRYRITYDVLDFYLNKQGKNEIVYNADSKEEVLGIIKLIFQSFIS